MADTGKTIALIKALAKVDPADIQESVEDWLDDHPEATTTVQDGSVTKAKLDSNLQSTVDDVSDLKSALNDIGLLDEMIMGTVQTISFDQSGNVSQITHSRNGAVVRTDVFTFGANAITEVRTLAATGESVTIVTNTTTLETTITHTAA